jgi:Tol biopolymer transport system component
MPSQSIWTDRPGLYVQDLAEDAPPRLIFDRQGNPSWSHNGQKVVVSVKVGEQKFETWRVDVDGTAPIKLPVPDTDIVFDCSDDGNWFAARTMGGEPACRGRLTLFHPDGTGHRSLTEGSAAGDRFVIPRISPDARQVAYTEIITKNDIRTSRLYVVDVDGKNRRQIPVPFEPDTTAQVCWAPDGKRLAVNAINLLANSSWIGVVDIEHQSFRKLPVVVQSPAPVPTPEEALKPQNRGQPDIEIWYLRTCDWR